VFAAGSATNVSLCCSVLDLRVHVTPQKSSWQGDHNYYITNAQTRSLNGSCGAIITAHLS